MLSRALSRVVRGPNWASRTPAAASRDLRTVAGTVVGVPKELEVGCRFLVVRVEPRGRLNPI